MPDKTPMEEALTKAIEAAVEAYSKSAAASLLSNVTSEAIRAMSADAVSALLGAVAGGLLKSALNLQDGVLKRVDSLVREPFETGVRVANEALTLPQATAEERQFRQSRLQFAVEKLDEAESVAAKGQDAEDLSAIAVIQVFCLSQINGAQALAHQRASKVLTQVEKKLRSLDASIARVEHEMQVNRDAAANELRKLEDWPKGTLALLNPKGPSDYRVQSNIFTSVAEHFEREALAYERRRRALQSIREVLVRI